MRAVANPPNPWRTREVELLEPAPPAELQVWEEEAKSILAKNESPDLSFRWSLNPYRGCFHGCAYCYARPRHEFLGWGAGTDFETRIVAKVNAPALLRRGFEKSSWRGELVAFSGDTVPNRWWVEHTQGVDFAIHECFLTPNQAIDKWGFSKGEALNALTKVHATAALFGKVMAMTRPKHAVAYHFQNDADTLPGVMAAVQSVYDGPVDYAQDFMVWNITKDGVRTRMAVPNRESYPTPPLAEKIIDKTNPYVPPAWVSEGWAEEAIPFVEQIYTDFNKEHGTNFKFK